MEVLGAVTQCHKASLDMKGLNTHSNEHVHEHLSKIHFIHVNKNIARCINILILFSQ